MSFPGQSLQRAWHLVDAQNQTVGRLANQISQILKGKHKPTFRPNKDMGDHVVVINAEKVGTVQFWITCDDETVSLIYIFSSFLIQYFQCIPPLDKTKITIRSNATMS